MFISVRLVVPLICAAAVCGVATAAQSTASSRTESIASDGSVQIPSFRVPFSSFGSEEARQAFIALRQSNPAPATTDIAVLRAHYAKFAETTAAKLKARFPVETEDQRIGGIAVRVVRTKDAARRDPSRLLICLHGGTFMWGERIQAEVESIAIASTSGIDVVGVDYREAPEHPFPAAVDDAIAVYRELLKTHAPDSIGIYGGSAGAIITGEVIAALIERKLPTPGAIGLFNGGIAELAGDSVYWANPLTGQPPIQQQVLKSLKDIPYFTPADMHSFLVLPANDPEKLKNFPPALLLSSSRDFTLSSVLYSERLLSRAGAPTELHVWDGLSHDSFGNADLPETRDMLRFTSEFFHKHLASHKTQ
jgi:acetyl esterase/lipase